MVNLIALGDIHCNLHCIHAFIRKYDIKDTIFLQVGDFCINPSTKNLLKLQKALKATGNCLYINRGNHDNYFNHYPEDSTDEGKHSFKLNLIDPNIIKFTKDYDIYNFNGYNFLFIGGAISIDRKSRDLNQDYWSNEHVKQYECLDNILKDKINLIDVIISHTSPSYYAPYGFSGMCYKCFKDDPTLERELIREREYLSNVSDLLNPYLIVNGHFHNDNKEYREQTIKLNLGIDSFLCIDNYVTINEPKSSYINV